MYSQFMMHGQKNIKLADGRITDNNWTQIVCEVVDGINIRQDAEKWCRVLKNILDLQVHQRSFLIKGTMTGFSHSHLDNGR